MSSSRNLRSGGEGRSSQGEGDRETSPRGAQLATSVTSPRGDMEEDVDVELSIHHERIQELKSQIREEDELIHALTLSNDPANSGDHGGSDHESSDNSDDFHETNRGGGHRSRSDSPQPSYDGEHEGLGILSPIGGVQTHVVHESLGEARGAGVGQVNAPEGIPNSQDTPSEMAVLATTKPSERGLSSPRDDTPVGGARSSRIKDDGRNQGRTRRVISSRETGGAQSDMGRNPRHRRESHDSKLSRERHGSNTETNDGPGKVRGATIRSSREELSDFERPDPRIHSGEDLGDRGLARQHARRQSALRNVDFDDRGDDQDDRLPTRIVVRSRSTSRPRDADVRNQDDDRRELDRFRKERDMRIERELDRSRTNVPRVSLSHSIGTERAYVQDHSMVEGFGGVANSFVSRSGKRPTVNHTSNTRNDGSSGFRRDRYPPGPTRNSRELRQLGQPVSIQARENLGSGSMLGGGCDAGLYHYRGDPVGIQARENLGIESLPNVQGTMARQILRLNELYRGFITNQRVESKLARKEGECIQDLYLHENEDSEHSDDEVPTSYDLEEVHRRSTRNRGPGPDCKTVRELLMNIQQDLKQTRKMGTTLKRDMSRFLIKEFNMSGEQDKYDKSLVLTKFAWPSGIDGRASQEVAHRLKAELHKLFSAHSHVLAPVLPMYDEMSGVTKGHQEGKPRYVPPDSSLGGTIVNGSKHVPYFDAKYATANEALYEVLERALGGYALVRRFFGRRSYGTTVSNRTMCHGRDKDGLSILCSILMYHESTTFSAKRNLKTKLDHSHGLFAKGSIAKAIAATRRLIEEGHLYKVKLDYNVIATIAGTLSQRNSMFAIKLEKWLEARDGIHEHDALGTFDEFLCEVDQINQKISVTVPGAVTHESLRAMRVLRVDTDIHTDSDDSDMESNDHVFAYSTNHQSGFRGKQGAGKGRGPRRNPSQSGSAHRSHKTCRALDCSSPFTNGTAGDDTFLCQKCFYKLVETGSVKLKNGTTRTSRGKSRQGGSTSTFKRKPFQKKAYANKVTILSRSKPRLLNGDHGSTKKGQENNPNDLFVGGCLTDSHRQVSSDDRMTSKVRIQCGRVIMVKGPRNKNPVDRSLSKPATKGRNQGKGQGDRRGHNVHPRPKLKPKVTTSSCTTILPGGVVQTTTRTDKTTFQPCRVGNRHCKQGYSKTRNSTTKTTRPVSRGRGSIGGPSGVYAKHSPKHRRHVPHSGGRSHQPKPKRIAVTGVNQNGGLFPTRGRYQFGNINPYSSCNADHSTAVRRMVEQLGGTDHRFVTSHERDDVQEDAEIDAILTEATSRPVPPRMNKNDENLRSRRQVELCHDDSGRFVHGQVTPDGMRFNIHITNGRMTPEGTFIPQDMPAGTNESYQDCQDPDDVTNVNIPYRDSDLGDISVDSIERIATELASAELVKERLMRSKEQINVFNTLIARLGRSKARAMLRYEECERKLLLSAEEVARIEGHSTHKLKMHNVFECIKHAPPCLRNSGRSTRPQTRIVCNRVHISNSMDAVPPRSSLLEDGHSRKPDEYLHFRAVVDTGCSSSLFKGNTGTYLTEATPSPAHIVGFEGGRGVDGGIRGIAHCYAISENPSHRGAYFKHMVDTVEGLNDNLFSIHNLTRFKGYKMVVSANPGTVTGLHSDPSQPHGKHVIPVTFNDRHEGFRIELVIAPTKELAIKWGRFEESLRFRKGKQRSKSKVGIKDAKESNSPPCTDGLESILAYPTRINNTGQASVNAACDSSQSLHGVPSLITKLRNELDLTNTPRSMGAWRDTVDGIARRTGGPTLTHRCSLSGKSRNISLCTNDKYDIDCRLPRLSIECEANSADKSITTHGGPTVEVGSLYVDSTIGDLIKAHRVISRETTINHKIHAYNGSISNSSPLKRVDNMSGEPEPTIPDSGFGSTNKSDEPPHDSIDDNMISGTKAGLQAREKRLTQFALHKRHGHLGHVPGCLICKMVRGSMRRVASKVDPHVETRPGYSWVCDMATWSHESIQGNRYCIVMRDIASGYFVALHANQRDESLGLVRDWIVKARLNPLFADLGFPIVQSLRLDKAGEWGINNKAWNAMISDLGVRPEYTSPDDKRSASHAENAVKQIEVVAKSILLENSLPYCFIEFAVNQGVMLRNLYPLARNVSSQDGDTIRPLEEISNGQISRRMCDNRIHHLIPLGSPCLVHCPKVKGTRIDKLKSRWGISIGTTGDLPEFFCPFDTSMSIRFHSKNYFECGMPDGWNYFTLLGLEAPMQPGDAHGNSVFPMDHEADTKLHGFIDISQFVGQRDQRIKSPYTPAVRDGADPNGILVPQVTLVDKSGTIYHQIDGDFKPTNKNVGKDLSSVMDTTDPMKRQKLRLMRAVSHYPKSLRGEVLFKNYPGFGCYEGVIKSYNSKEKQWTIAWEDGMKEHMDVDDLHKYLIQKVDDHHRDLSPGTSESEEEGPLKVDIVAASTPLGAGRRVQDNRDSGRSLTVPQKTPRVHKQGNLKRRKTQLRCEEIGYSHGQQNDKSHDKPKATTGSRRERLGRDARVRSRPTDMKMGGSNSDSGIGGGPSMSAGTNDDCDEDSSSDDEIANTVENVSMASLFKDPNFAASLKWFTLPRNSRLTFLKVCDALGIDPKHRRAYYDWLGPTFGPRGTTKYVHETNPNGSKSLKYVGCKFSAPWGVGRNTLISAGTVFPIPSGEMWNTFKLTRDRVDQDQSLCFQTSEKVVQGFKREIVRAYATKRIAKEIVDDPLTIERNYAYLSPEPESREVNTPTYDSSKSRQEQIMKILEDESFDVETGGSFDPKTGKSIPPKSLKMLSRADRAEWANVTLKELDTLDSLGVLDHDHTLADIRKLGINNSPVSMLLIYDPENLPDGTYDKFNARDSAHGNKGSSRQGEHLTTTFSAAPKLVTTRLLQALHAALGLKCKVWSIEMAYLWAPCREDEKIPIRYPIGLRRYDRETGKELYGILRKNC